MIENLDEYKQGDELYLVQFYPYSFIMMGIFKCKFICNCFLEEENKEMVVVTKCKGHCKHPIAISQTNMLFKTEELAIEGARQYLENNIDNNKHELQTMKKTLRSLSNKKIIKK